MSRSSWNTDLTGWFMPGAPKRAKWAAGCLLAWGVLSALVGGWFINSRFGPGATVPRHEMDAVFAGAIVAIAVLALLSGSLLVARKKLGWWLAWVVVIPSLLAFPGGTFLSVFTILGLIDEEARAYVSRRPYSRI